MSETFTKSFDMNINYDKEANVLEINGNKLKLKNEFTWEEFISEIEDYMTEEWILEPSMIYIPEEE